MPDLRFNKISTLPVEKKRSNSILFLMSNFSRIHGLIVCKVKRCDNLNPNFTSPEAKP
ncbi:hypothetical protein SAMN02744775_01922 [Enterobacter sp. CC120223-11]|nr:hypothetical protein SAMN02744775_01922 [Enterobacter sp. CC120223-11]